MDTSESNDWPDVEYTNESNLAESAEGEPPSSADQEDPSAVESVESSESHDEKTKPVPSVEGDGFDDVKTEPEPWTLPIRAAPILSLQGENVVEFPLSQHVNGLSSTSVVVDEKLMRIVEARYDPDGVRRLNVRMALVKEHISGYSHTHLDVFAKLQPAWWSSIGLGLLFATSWLQGWLVLGGGMFVLAGIAGLLLRRLDLHRISFSDHGGRHDFFLSGWRQDPYLIHNSTALLGPAFVEFLRTGELETVHIDNVVESMGRFQEPAPMLKTAPTPKPSATLPEPAVRSALPLPKAAASDPPEPAAPVLLPSSSHPQGPPIGPPAPVAEPTTPQPIHAPLPPVASLPPQPQPTPAPPPPVASLPPPPALPPAPLPPPSPPGRPVDEDALWDELS